jgi:HPr kinase/phosphorylase
MSNCPPPITIQTETIHGSALAIGEKGLLILGDSGVGKSRLLVDILADNVSPKARLVADDRVCLFRHMDRLVARPHPLIAGRIELRGLGIQSFPYLESVVLHSALRLVSHLPPRMPEIQTLSITFLGVTLSCVSLPTQSFSAQYLRAILPSLNRMR